jgi:hypothetical protein
MVLGAIVIFCKPLANYVKDEKGCNYLVSCFWDFETGHFPMGVYSTYTRLYLPYLTPEQGKAKLPPRQKPHVDPMLVFTAQQPLSGQGPEPRPNSAQAIGSGSILVGSPNSLNFPKKRLAAA